MAYIGDEPRHTTILLGEDPEPPVMKRCTQCCTKFHCDFCSPSVFKSTRGDNARRHYKAHLKGGVRHNGYTTVLCHLDCRSGPHFHCYKCLKTLRKKDSFVHHLRICNGEAPLAPKDYIYTTPAQVSSSCKAQDDEEDIGAPLDFPPGTPGQATSYPVGYYTSDSYGGAHFPLVVTPPPLPHSESSRKPLKRPNLGDPGENPLTLLDPHVAFGNYMVSTMKRLSGRDSDAFMGEVLELIQGYRHKWQ